MHDLFHLSFRIIAEIISFLPNDYVTSDINAWMKGISPGEKITVDFCKVRNVTELMLEVRDSALEKTKDMQHQLMMLIEPLHYLVIDFCYNIRTTPTWLAFSLVTVHCMGIWCLLNDFDLANYHDDANKENKYWDKLFKYEKKLNDLNPKSRTYENEKKKLVLKNNSNLHKIQTFLI